MTESLLIGNIFIKLSFHKSILGYRKFKLFSNKQSRYFSKEDKSEVAKIRWRILKSQSTNSLFELSLTWPKIFFGDGVFLYVQKRDQGLFQGKMNVPYRQKIELLLIFFHNHWLFCLKTPFRECSNKKIWNLSDRRW